MMIITSLGLAVAGLAGWHARREIHHDRMHKAQAMEIARLNEVRISDKQLEVDRLLSLVKEAHYGNRANDGG